MKPFLERLIVLAFSALLFGGCKSTSVSTIDEVMIRIHNKSPYSMEEVFVSFPEEEIHYGNILPGEESTYHEVAKAYRYAYIETVVDAKKLAVVPIDYVGESLLKPGLYTYELGIDEQTLHSDNYQYALTLRLKEE